MIAGLISDSVFAMIATVTIGGLAVGLVMLGATWGPRVGRDQQIVQGGLDVDRLRCPACGGIKFSRETHNCPKAAPVQRQVQPIRIDVHVNSPAPRPTTRADYDRPPPPPPPPIPIEARARP